MKIFVRNSIIIVSIIVVVLIIVIFCGVISKNKNREVANLNERIDLLCEEIKLRDEKVKVEKEAKDADSVILTTDQDLEEEVKEKDSLMEELLILKREINLLGKENSGSSKEIANLEKKNLTLNEQLSQLEKKCSEDKKEKEEKDKKILILNQEIKQLREEVKEKETKEEEVKEKDSLKERISILNEEIAQLKRERLNNSKTIEQQDSILAELKLKILNSAEEIKNLKERCFREKEESIPSGQYQKKTDEELKTLLKSTFPGEDKWRDVTFCQASVFPLKFYQDNFDKNLSNLSPGKFISFLSTGVRGYVWTLKNNSWSLVPIIIAIDSSNKSNVYYYTKEGLIRAIGNKDITPFVLSVSLFD